MLFQRSLVLFLFITLAGCANSSQQRKDSKVDSLETAVAKPTPAISATISTGVAVPSPTLTPVVPEIAEKEEPAENAKVSATPAQAELFDSEQVKFQVSENQWKQISDEDGVQAYREKNPVGDIVGFRGETIIPTTLQKVAAVLSDFSNRKEWVDALVEDRIVDQKSVLERIEYNHSKVPWPFQDRDFLYSVAIKVNKSPAMMLINMKSIEDQREPPHDGIVRGEIIHSFYYMKQLPGATPSTKLVIEMAVNPKGAIPAWLVNATQKSWPHNTMMSLRKLAMKPDLAIPQNISDFFADQPSGIPAKNKKMK